MHDSGMAAPVLALEEKGRDTHSPADGPVGSCGSAGAGVW